LEMILCLTVPQTFSSILLGPISAVVWVPSFKPAISRRDEEEDTGRRDEGREQEGCELHRRRTRRDFGGTRGGDGEDAS
jgi:hypothetical protein